MGLTIGLLTASCSARGGVLAQPSPSTVRAPQGLFFGFTWLGQGTAYVAYRSQVPEGTDLYQLNPGGGSWIRIPLPSLAGCNATDYQKPTPLGDGRLGLVRVCSRFAEDRSTLVAFDPRTRKLTPLAPGYVTYPVTQFTWDDRTGSGYISSGGGFCDGIQGVSAAAGFIPAPITVGDGSHSFRVDAPLSGPQCGATGLARLPALSPDGTSFAFIASTDAVGRTGMRRLDAAYELYVADARTLRPQATGLRVANGTSLDWSPDGRTLAFTGDVVGKGRGLWLYSVNDHSFVHLSDADAAFAAWSPYGGQILVEVVVDETMLVSKLVVLTVR